MLFCSYVCVCFCAPYTHQIHKIHNDWRYIARVDTCAHFTMCDKMVVSHSLLEWFTCNAFSIAHKHHYEHMGHIFWLKFGLFLTKKKKKSKSESSSLFSRQPIKWSSKAFIWCHKECCACVYARLIAKHIVTLCDPIFDVSFVSSCVMTFRFVSHWSSTCILKKTSTMVNSTTHKNPSNWTESDSSHSCVTRFWLFRVTIFIKWSK